MKYWKVKAKCGHVRRSKYIIKNLYVKADSGSEAAKTVRRTSRVKHHDKYAIIETKKITEKEYLIGLKTNSLDPFFHVHSKQEQERKCIGIDYETLYEKEAVVYKKKTNVRRHLIEKQLDVEWKKERSNQQYE